MMAAGLGSFLQIHFISQGKASMSKSRVVVSLVFTVLGIAAVYTGPPDIYIMMAVAASRFGELFDDPRRLKLGYLLADSLWFVYAAEVGMVSVYWGCVAMVGFMVYEMFKEYREVFVRVQSTRLVA